jgi:ABC-type lipoprotein export system ATPase subunit
MTERESERIGSGAVIATSTRSVRMPAVASSRLRRRTTSPASGGWQTTAGSYRVALMVLEVVGLRKAVGRDRAARRLLVDVELEVDAGELVAVLGRSGSGKSTLLHLIGGLDRPDGGSIAVAGEQLVGASDPALTRIRLHNIGFVFQSYALVEELTGEENVLLPARLPGAPAGGRRRARRLIGELGLEGVIGHLPHELSGGEQQRFAIARALVNDPALVLADEPTGNLDVAAAADVLGLLRAMAQRGRAVVMVTHEPEAASVADRVLHLVDGRLVPSELEARLGTARLRGLAG